MPPRTHATALKCGGESTLATDTLGELPQFEDRRLRQRPKLHDLGVVSAQKPIARCQHRSHAQRVRHFQRSVNALQGRQAGTRAGARRPWKRTHLGGTTLRLTLSAVTGDPAAVRNILLTTVQWAGIQCGANSEQKTPKQKSDLA
jgi:hypothetical protein